MMQRRNANYIQVGIIREKKQKAQVEEQKVAKCMVAEQPLIQSHNRPEQEVKLTAENSSAFEAFSAFGDKEPRLQRNSLRLF